ncbi:MAG: Eco57I restriction-modification methylase domain-containing protein, partial [Deltaproteobacteria bacterium]|nr:Eco57I restriction-modification methylase domain-containing protein [Deltaproteobacteria bacterium]
FHWVFEFPEVFLDRGGFDVVVGNPPYVRQEGINHIVEGIDYKEILSRIYEPFDNTFDFSMFFILRSIWVSKDKGYHSFIITNKWLRAKYGKKIRRFLKENFTIKKVIDFNGIRVFVGATVDTFVYVIQKKKPERGNLIFYTHPLSWDSIERGGYKVKQSSLSDDVWNFVDERTEEIKNWIEKVGKPLKYLDVKIYRGITTGFNEAFVIDDETRKRLIEEYPKSAELIKPLLRGRDIGRYYVEWDRKWIIIIPAGFTKNLRGKNAPLEEAERIFKKNYPSIYSHFEQFKNIESGRGKGLVNR